MFLSHVMPSLKKCGRSIKRDLKTSLPKYKGKRRLQKIS